MAKIEIDSEAALQVWLSSEPRPPAIFQQLDLTTLGYELLQHDLAGCRFFGCKLTADFMAAVQQAGCLVYPEDAFYPFLQFRPRVYDVDELFAGFDPARPESYFETLDRKIYLTYADATTRRPLPSNLDEILARRIHDNSISDALEEILTPRRLRAVAIMGGHDTHRSSSAYRAVALLAHSLSNKGYFVVSGGGPGIMEAANLGAFFKAAPVSRIDSAIAVLKTADLYSHEHWLVRAWEVRQAALREGITPGESVGIPTWFYGHEPPNVFSSHIAKYFENSLREEGLLAVGLGGVIFAEGNGGTVQEIFQDACQNYYRTYGSATEGLLSPMILLDDTYWNDCPNNAKPKAKPLYPLLRSLSREKDFLDYLYITPPLDEGTVQDVVRFIDEHPPVVR